MQGSKLYLLFWQKLLPLLKQYLKMSLKGPQEIKLSKSDFKAAGDRDKYTFSLALEKGKVTNNIASSAVARDLADALQNNVEIKSWLIEHSVAINLDNNFVLKIRSIPEVKTELPTPVEAQP